MVQPGKEVISASGRANFGESQTNSGLRLGLTQAQLKAILEARCVYLATSSFTLGAYKKSTPPRGFEQLRKNYPRQLNDKEAHELLDSFDVQLYIEARFENSKLHSIAISSQRPLIGVQRPASPQEELVNRGSRMKTVLITLLFLVADHVREPLQRSRHYYSCRETF